MSENMVLEGPIVIDLNEVRDEPIADGWHLVVVERVDPGYSRQQHIPQVFVLSRVTDEGDPDFNRTIIWNSMLAGDGRRFSKRFFLAAGLPALLQYPTADALAADLVGRAVLVKTKAKLNPQTGEVNVNCSSWKAPQSELDF